ncbi:hypothetical protein FRC00_003231 [Tulasnella sp. 408]|nr:hypothetical protein FRC00_003231 [Tulasnella sp. 408]
MAETYYAMKREQVLSFVKDTRSFPVSELKSAIRGSVLTRHEPEFDQNLKLFNGGLQSPACMLVFPRSAKDVSEIILFCTRHGLSPSVKAGGYGTHGLAVEGDVIIDLREINYISISVEDSPPGSTFTMDTNPGRDRLSRSPLSTNAAGDDPTPPLPCTSAHSPAPASPSLALIGRPGPPPPAAVVPPPRGPFSYPSSSSRPSGPFGYEADTSSTSTPPNRPSEPFGYAADANSLSASTSFADHSGQVSGSSASYAIHPIEPPHPFVYVKFGAGASQKHVDKYMSEHPFSGTTAFGGPIDVPYYVPFAAHPNGSAVMLLGGFGFQTRLRGLSVDSLVEVEMVLADGRIILVNEREHPDLWWAVRGAGSAFGVAIRYMAKAYPIPVVYAGNII